MTSDWYGDVSLLDASIRHRGPDDHGFFTDTDRGEVPRRLGPQSAVQSSPQILFVHRRLSILDLSEMARQPMVRERVFLTYNGEVYNYRELRTELETLGARFRTTSDTEVVLEAYRQWGIGAVKRLRGIFAFAIADLGARKVYLVRDHLGVKPLYYGATSKGIVFSSDVRSLTAHRWFERSLDFSALRAYLHLLWIPGEQTGLQEIKKLAPGTWLEIDLETTTPHVQTYWRPDSSAHHGPTTGPEAVEYLRTELDRVVSEQMVSDVPLGAFLSGGLDSSIVTALMRRRSSDVRTFSVGYSPRDLAYDIVPNDLPYAREASARFGTRNTEIVLSPAIETLLPSVVDCLGEPVGDPAAISSYLICENARRSLTVMLSGMGADEIFAGYPRQRALLYGETFRALPAFARRAFMALVSPLPAAGRTRLAKIGRAAHKFVAAAERDPLSHYIAMESYFDQALQVPMFAAGGPFGQVSDPVEALVESFRGRTEGEEPLHRSMRWDLETYLPNLNLAYTDRTSMAHGLEVRVPFLDVKLVEWALQLRANELVRWRRGRLEGKWILKRAANPWVGDSITWRQKAGFGAPIRSWLRNELQEMARELLGRSGLGGRGWFEPAFLSRLFDDFISGRKDYALHIWTLASLELWLRRVVTRG